MKKALFIIIGAWLAIFLEYPGGAGAQSEKIWVDGTKDIGRAYISDLFFDKDEGLFISTADALYVSSDQGKQWHRIFRSSKSGTRQVRCFAVRGQTIYLGTSNGLFRSKDCGERWSALLYSAIMPKKDITCIDVSRDDGATVIVGTGGGVFVSGDGGDSWTRSLKRGAYDVLVDGPVFYAALDNGLFISKDLGRHWEKILIRLNAKEEADEEGLADEAPEESEEEGRDRIVIYRQGGNLYAASGRSISLSGDNGKTWVSLPQNGIEGDIQDILVSRDTGSLFVATTQGVYEYRGAQGSWEALSGDMPHAQVRKIEFDVLSKDILWAATDKGFYRLESIEFCEQRRVEVEEKQGRIVTLLDSEPAFIQLQKAALRYNEVGPEKIRSWRNDARLKAFIPKVSFGIDNHRSSNAEIYTSATRSFIFDGPDSVSKDWDVSLSWELGDMLYSDDQTSIDVRSRLTTQLRKDILDDLRQAYYQRKRLLMELSLEQPRDPKILLEKELRLQELTSEIDDLTGNYLSAYLEKQRVK